MVKITTIHQFSLTSDDVRCAIIEYIVKENDGLVKGYDPHVRIFNLGDSLKLYDVTADVNFESAER